MVRSGADPIDVGYSQEKTETRAPGDRAKQLLTSLTVKKGPRMVLSTGRTNAAFLPLCRPRINVRVRLLSTVVVLLFTAKSFS